MFFTNKAAVVGRDGYHQLVSWGGRCLLPYVYRLNWPDCKLGSKKTEKSCSVQCWSRKVVNDDFPFYLHGCVLVLSDKMPLNQVIVSFLPCITCSKNHLHCGLDLNSVDVSTPPVASIEYYPFIQFLPDSEDNFNRDSSNECCVNKNPSKEHDKFDGFE